MPRHRSRAVLAPLHKHLGLWVGVLFALLGLTGSFLVFYLEADAVMHPQTRPQPFDARAVSAQRAIEALRAAFPDRSGSWRIELPLSADDPIRARYAKPRETAQRVFAPLLVTLDPASYRVTSTRFWGQEPSTWIYDLHYTLLAEQEGQTVVGWLGLAMLIAILSGLCMWWPRTGRRLHALKPEFGGGTPRRVYRLHALAGVYAAVLLGMLALTGAALALPQATRSLLGAALTFQAPLPSFRALAGPTQAVADLDALVARARTALPQAEVRWIETSGEDGREVTIRMFHPPEPSRRFPQTYIKLHPVNAQVLALRDAHQLPAGDRVWAWIHPLHNGEAFGLAGRLLLAAAGLIPALLLVTGWLRWRHKRAARIRTAARRSAI